MRVVVTCEHGGARIPPRYREAFAGAEEVLASHRGWDRGALALARRLALELDAPLIASTTSRLLVDLNRSEQHPRHLSEYTRGLDEDTRREVVDRYYRPYRTAVLDTVRSAAEDCGVIHLSVHSFTPVLAGRVRDVDLGLLYDPRRPFERALCEAWARALRGELPAFRVRRNAPYRGDSDGFTTALRRVFGAGAYRGIEVELNQALVPRRGMIARVASALAATLEPQCSSPRRNDTRNNQSKTRAT